MNNAVLTLCYAIFSKYSFFRAFNDKKFRIFRNFRTSERIVRNNIYDAISETTANNQAVVSIHCKVWESKPK